MSSIPQSVKRKGPFTVLEQASVRVKDESRPDGKSSLQLKMLVWRRSNNRLYGIGLSSPGTSLVIYDGGAYVAVCYRAFRLLAAYLGRRPVELPRVAGYLGDCFSAVNIARASRTFDLTPKPDDHIAVLLQAIGPEEYEAITGMVVGAMPPSVCALAMKQ